VGTFVQKNAAQSGERKTLVSSFSGSKRAHNLIAQSGSCMPSKAHRILEPGIPALDLFPIQKWSKCYNTAILRFGRDFLNFEDPMGHPELRSMIASHIGPSRGVSCSADQILIVSSLRQALHVLFQYFLDKNDPVLLENPCLPEVKSVAVSQQLDVIPMTVLTDGADIVSTEKK
jgi:GntR family transcriptional regulator/MocR family aminotransferase